MASETVGAVVNILIGIFTKHLRYLTSSRKYVTDMTNRLNVLVGKSGDVKRHMDKNKEDRKEIPTRVPSWLEEVENIKKDVESISSNVFGCLHMKKRYRAGRKASKVIEKIERLIDEEKEIKWSDAIIPLGKVYSKLASTFAPSPPVQITQNDFVSRDEGFKDALKFLQQEGEASQVIALCGMGGVGKTTMMEQLKEVAEDSKMFHWIVKVTIGQNPNMFSVQNDVAQYLRDQDLPAEASKILRADHLCKKIKNLSRDGKKILVILDDVWDNIELKDIGLTSPLPKGIKLLLTSRDSKICKQLAACVHSKLQEVPVDVLKEKEARSFFSQIAGISKERDHDLYHIGCDIVKKCGYLPLAIKLIASTLNSQKEEYIWRDTHSRLMKYHFNDVVQEIIRISYNYIKKDEQQILLLCGLFPEDLNIPIEDLMRHAWGLKLFKDVSTLKEARDRTRTYVHNLICANLLMNGDDLGYVKMHDLVLAFVLGEVSKGDYAWIINHGDVSKWEKDERCESCKSISLTCRGLSEFPTNIKYPNLSFLQLKYGDKLLTISDVFYENVKNVKVITYYDIQYPLLPSSLTNLTNLCLHYCKLMFDCSFVGDLVNLEVLSFAHSGIRKLPSTIGNLRNLKLLDLTGCIDLYIDDGVFKNLINLEELYMRADIWVSKSIRFTQANIEELKTLLSKLCALEVEFVDRNTRPEKFSFTKLDEFKISIGCSFFDIDCNDKWSFRKMLKLATDATYLRDCKINELINKTENLYLEVEDMICLEDVVSIGPSNPDLFCNLRDLEVSNCADLKYLFPIYVATGLRKLECLKISECFALEALVHNDRREIINVDEIINFEKLKFLSLKDLPKLVPLFPIENAVELPQLFELEVNKLPNFTSIYPYKNNSSALQQPLFNSQVRISQIKKLKISSMVKLKHIWSCEIDSKERNSISMLREIEVEKCDSLLNIFPTNPMPLFNNLEKLFVKECGSIKEIFNIDSEERNSISMLREIEVEECKSLLNIFPTNPMPLFNNLEKLSVKECGSIKEIFNIDLEFSIDSEERNSISMLREIQVRGCDSVLNIFPTNPMPLFNNLEKLSVGGCGSIKEIFNIDLEFNIDSEERNSISMLREIEVWRCDSLLNIFPTNPMPLFNNLERLFVLECGSIKEIFNIDLECKSKDVQHSSSMLRNIHVSRSQNLREIWRIKGDENNFSFLIGGFEGVEIIDIWECERFRNVFTPTNTKIDLRALTKLHINSWHIPIERDDNISTFSLRGSITKPEGNLEVKR